VTVNDQGNQTGTVMFSVKSSMNEDSSLQTSFVVDDTALNVS
jgi:hypothetical protein